MVGVGHRGVWNQGFWGWGLTICLDFGSSEDTRSYTCLFLANNLGFGDLWWLLGLVQLSPLLPLLVLYRYIQSDDVKISFLNHKSGSITFL